MVQSGSPDLHVNSTPGFGGVTAQAYATQAIIMGRLHAYNLVTLAFIAAVNVSATILICLRLWIAHRRTYILSLSKYKSTIIVVVECGALITISTVAILILYAVKHPTGLAGLGVTTQLAVSRPQLNDFNLLHDRSSLARLWRLCLSSRGMGY